MTHEKEFNYLKLNGNLKQITHSPDYFASRYGQIFSTKNHKIRKLKPILTSQAKYKTCILFNHGHPKNHYVHTLVLEAFVSKRPAGLVCRHGKKGMQNNTLENLCWGTQSQNIGIDRERDGTDSNGERNGNAVLNWEAVELIREFASIVPLKRMAKAFRVSRSHISRIINLKSWVKMS